MSDDGIDWKTVDSILLISSRDKQLMPELINLFKESSSQNILDIKRSISLRNLREIKNFAHALKSVCNSIGAKRARELADAVESVTPDFNTKDVLQIVENLENEIGRNIIALTFFVESRGLRS
ncbi:Hpt domain-containing protein [bacterium]|nr:Hpt domain-containing protein [bacterium]